MKIIKAILNIVNPQGVLTADKAKNKERITIMMCLNHDVLNNLKI